MTPRLRIAIVSKATAKGGGAGRVADDLAAGLRRRGHAVDRFAAWPGRGNGARPLYRGLGQASGLAHRATRAAGLQEILPLEALGFPARDYDLVHLHDITWAASPFFVSFLARRVPTLWTFHDCSPFTGGCIQPLGCERFRQACGQCPRQGHWPLVGRLDCTRLLRAAKAWVARQGGFTPLAPSRWLAGEAVRSGLFPDPPRVAPNAVDTDIFAPRDRDAARRELGLPVDRRIALVAAGNLGDPWKGLAQVREALARLGADAPLLAVAGRVDAAAADILRDVAHVPLGYLDEPARMALAHAAADVFLAASLAESFGLASAEALACGTPVLGFGAGATPEVCASGECGLLVPPGDTAALAAALDQAFADDVLSRWAQAGRQRAEALFSLPVFLDRHEDLYQAALAGGARP